MSLRPAISSMSLGRAWVHKLPKKLLQLAAVGIKGIEIFYEDLEYLAREEANLTSYATPPPETLRSAARTIRSLCDDYDLCIICLQPFMHYEGLRARTQHAARIEKMKLWFQIAAILKTDTIQIPASFLPKEEITDDIEIVIRDLREVADMGLQQAPPIKFAYENLCWSTYFDTWEQGWDIVQKVDRGNFGVCLDTFNIAGRVYGDPASDTRCTPNAEEDLRKSLHRLVKTIDIRKVFFIQLVDAEKMRDPLVKGHTFYDAKQPARMSWSRNARLFAFEQGGYLPVMDVLKAIVEGLGYRGWVSMELFSRTMNEVGDEVPAQHAKRAAESWKKVQQATNGWDIR